MRDRLRARRADSPGARRSSPVQRGVTPIEAILAVQAALEDHGLPGGVGLREADRTFIVVPAPADRWAVPAITALLTAMGCECSVDRHGIVSGRLAGRLRPAPPLPPVDVSAVSTGQAAGAAAVTIGKRCKGPCGQVKPLEEFPFWRKARGYRGPACYECDRARQRAQYRARTARTG